MSETIFSSVEPAPAAPDDTRAWSAFAGARGANAFCQAWLALQCRMIPDVAGALLLLEDDGAYTPAAVIGAPGRDWTELAEVAEQALRGRRQAVVRAAGNVARVAYPVDVRGRLWGAVVVDLGPADEASVQHALRQLHWGAGWIEALFHRRQAELDATQLEAVRGALEMVAVIGRAATADEAAIALASEMASRLRCRRVAIGAVLGERVKLLALSHTAQVTKAMRLADTITHVMEEALDANAHVSFPALPATARQVSIAHRDYAQAERLGGVVSLILRQHGRPTAVLTLECDADASFDARTMVLCETVAELAGPVFALHLRQNRVLAGRAPLAIGRAGTALLGRGHPALKIGALAMVAGLAALFLITGEYRVSGKAVLEGVVQRQAVAPFDGFVAASHHRAGDIVAAGDVLAELDTREMALEALRYESQAAQARLRQQQAEGKHDRAEAAIAAANAAEAEAQLALANTHIAQARISAPFGGIVVSGDLSQMLGSPVERGKLLFEVAPLDDYRIAVQVDERDLVRIQPGQTGRLVLNGLSGRGFDFTVSKVVPVATPTDGRNSFRVEGLMALAGTNLRPGMEGVGKIVVGQESLIWAWTHPVIDWARLTLWKWLP